MSDQENQQNKPTKGFAGLLFMASHIEDEVRKSAEACQQFLTTQQRSMPHPSSENERPEPFQQPSTKWSSGAKWAFGIIGALLVICWLKSLDSKNETTPLIPTATTDAAEIKNSLSSPTATISNDAAAEEKPPEGSNLVFNANQIRYCLSEKIRLESAKSNVNANNSIDIDRFNAMITDYNSRCKAFRYKADMLETIRLAVESERTKLSMEGIARFPPIDNDNKPAQPAINTYTSQSQEPALISKDADNSNDTPSENTTTTLQLSQDDKSSIEAVCSTDKFTNGPVAYKSCVQSQLKSLEGSSSPDISKLNTDDWSSIQAVCSTDKLTKGPAAFRRCVQNQLDSLANDSTQPDFSGINAEERSSIQAVCSTEKLTRGPVAFHQCIQHQLDDLQANPTRPDLTTLSPSQKRLVKSGCITDKLTKGPAAYNACMLKQITALGY